MDAMRGGNYSFAIRHLDQLAQTHRAGDLADAELLEHFRSQREEAAFTILVQRHGPMVLGVCRRVLGNAEDPEDAFQATFLVLARNAAAIRCQGSLAGWLYGVASRISARARAQAMARRLRESQAAAKRPDPPDEVSLQELRVVLDQELATLPEKYRAPLVLCYLEGKTHEQAASELGWPKSSLSTRLVRARQLLRERLVRRGVSLSAAVLALALARQAAAAVPAGLVLSTAKAVRFALAGKTGVLSAEIAQLAEGAMKTMSPSSSKAVLMLGALVSVAAGAGVLLFPGAPAQQDVPQAQAPPMFVLPALGIHQHNRLRGPDNSDPLPSGAIARLGTTRLRHGGSTTAVAFATDGRTVITMGVDGLRIWDVATGKSLRHMANQADRNLYGGILASDAKQVLTAEFGDKRAPLSLWDVATGRLVRTFGDHPFLAACFSPDAKVLATLGSVQPRDPRYRGFTDVISLWDTTTGKRLRSWNGHKSGAYCGLFTADGKTLISGGGDKTIRFWDVATGTQVRCWDTGQAAVGHFTLSGDGKHLAAIDLERDEPAGIAFPAGLAWSAAESIRVWSMDSGKLVQHLAVSVPKARKVVSGFTGVAFTPDGKSVIAAGAGNFARVWDLGTGKELRRHDMGVPGVWSMALSPDGKVLAALPGGTALRLFDAKTGTDLLPLEGHLRRIWTAFITPDNRSVITSSADSEILVWDIAGEQECQRLTGHEAFVPVVLLAPDGHTIFSLGTGEHALIAWDLHTKQAHRVPLDPAFEIGQVAALSPDGHLLAVADSLHQELSLIDVRTGKQTRRLNGFSAPLTQVTFAPNGQTLNVLCDDHMASVWDPVRGTKLRQLPAREGQTLMGGPMPGRAMRLAEAAALSADGKLFAFGQDNWLGLFETQTGEQVFRVPTSPRGPDVFAFSPDGRLLAWAERSDSGIHIVEIATGEERCRFSGHQGPACRLTYSPDGTLLVSGGQDTTALVWDIFGLQGVKGKAGPLAPAQLEAAWVDLAGQDAARAQRAIGLLASDPVCAIPFLEKRLPPAPVLDEQRLVRLVNDLDSEKFAVRQAATSELEKLEEGGVPYYRKTLAAQPSAEVRRRLQGLLAKYAHKTSAFSTQQAMRVIEALELMGTGEARQVISKLAQGGPGFRLTKEANSALERLGRRPGRQP
jgi:RNA polymerase sigma factor (sigma-70 family)